MIFILHSLTLITPLKELNPQKAVNLSTDLSAPSHAHGLALPVTWASREEPVVSSCKQFVSSTTKICPTPLGILGGRQVPFMFLFYRGGSYFSAISNWLFFRLRLLLLLEKSPVSNKRQMFRFPCLLFGLLEENCTQVDCTQFCFSVCKCLFHPQYIARPIDPSWINPKTLRSPKIHNLPLNQI